MQDRFENCGFKIDHNAAKVRKLMIMIEKQLTTLFTEIPPHESVMEKVFPRDFEPARDLAVG